MKKVEPTRLSASGKPINLLTSFQHEIKLYFEDHMGPYRGIMVEKKGLDQESGPAEITRMFRRAHQENYWSQLQVSNKQPRETETNQNNRSRTKSRVQETYVLHNRKNN